MATECSCKSRLQSECPWCGEQHDPDDHDTVVQIPMSQYTIPELTVEALDKVEELIEALPRGRQRDRAMTNLFQVQTTVEVTDPVEDTLEVWSENLDQVEELANNHLDNLLAFSDGGHTGDWLIVTIAPAS